MSSNLLSLVKFADEFFRDAQPTVIKKKVNSALIKALKLIAVIPKDGRNCGYQTIVSSYHHLPSACWRL